MNSSYKIVLAVAAALFLFVMGYYLFQGDTEADRAGVDPTGEVAANDAATPPTTRSNLADLPRTQTQTQPTPPPRSTPTTGDNQDRMAALRQQVDQARSQTPPTPSNGEATGTTSRPPTFMLDRNTDAEPAPPVAALNNQDSASPTGTTPSPTQPSQFAPPPAAATQTPTPTPSSPTTTRQTTATTSPPADTPTPSPSPTASEAPSARTYTVQAGDTLSSIAQDLYGSDRRWVDIAQANPTVDPLKLQVDQVLRLPADAELRDLDTPRAQAPGAVIEYTVRPGDTLSSIAQQYYGSPSEWRILFNANRQTLGNNPDRLQAGMKLSVPPAPRLAE